MSWFVKVKPLTYLRVSAIFFDSSRSLKMARVCSISGKKRLSGNKVSHSQRKTRRVQHPNLITKRIFIPEENRTVTVKLSVRALRTVNKKGIQQVLKDEGIEL